LFDNRMLFSGVDAAGRHTLWVTDGTSGGTYQIDVPGGLPGGSSPASFGVLRDGYHWLYNWDAAWNEVATGDFNADGTADVIWRSPSSVIGVWLVGDNAISGAHVDATFLLPEMPGWQSVATGDFNGDGVDDIMWQNESGLVGAWYMQNGIRGGTAAIQSMPGWQVIATGDFNDDGIDDVIWDNGSGVQGGWLMGPNGQIGGTLQLPFFPDWTAVATGDYNGDGSTDILWQNESGLVAEWLMGAGTRQATLALQNLSGWEVAGSGDFNGDGTDDVLWRTDSGVTAAWFMQDGQIFRTTQYESSAGRTAVGAADYNGDGIDDVMWRDDATGQVDVWTFDQNGLLV
jgi:hypothetical protein